METEAVTILQQLSVTSHTGAINNSCSQALLRKVSTYGSGFNLLNCKDILCLQDLHSQFMQGYAVVCV